jgi:hypothetical protein
MSFITTCLVTEQIKKFYFTNGVLKMINAYWSYNRRKELLLFTGIKINF